MQETIELIAVDPTAVFFRCGHVPEMTADELSMLRNSIRLRGLRQPIRITPIDARRYRIVDGERRMLAILSLLNSGIILRPSKIKCYLVEFDNVFEELMDRFVCNLHRGFQTSDMQRVFHEVMEAGSRPADIAAYSGLPLSIVNSIIDGSGDPRSQEPSATPVPSHSAMQELITEVEAIRASIRGGPRILQVLRTAYDYSLGIVPLDDCISILQRATDEKPISP